MGFGRRILNLGRKSATPQAPAGSTLAEALQMIQSGGGMTSQYSSQLRDGYAANPYVFRCVDLRASSVASLTPILFDEDDNEIAGPHPLRELLKKPNPTSDWRTLAYDTMADMVIGGNGFIEKIMTVKGPTELWNACAGGVQLIQNAGDPYNLIRSWQITRNGMTVNREPKDVIHVLRGVKRADGVLAYSPLDPAGRSVDQQTQAKDWNISLMRNGAKPSVVIQNPHPMAPSKWDEMKARLDQRHTGSNNAGSTMLLDDGMTIATAGFNARDMDYAVGVTTSAKEIALALSVPPELIGDSANKTYSNAMEANKEFAKHCIVPDADALFSQLTRHLAPWFEDVARIGYDESEIDALRGDEAATMTALATVDFMTVNEKRERLSLPKVNDGDVILTPMGKVPLKEVATPIEDLVGDPDVNQS